MFEAFPIVEILTVVVIIELGCCFWLWRRLHVCCKKADDAYTASRWLWDWAKSLKLEEYLQCAALQNGCKPADPDWPPEDPGDFPGTT